MVDGISVAILTFNSGRSIARTLRAACQVSDDIHIVDSFSTDDTLEICQEFNCRVVQHSFANYADQRNWAIDALPFIYSWQLHLDADEELEPDLIGQLMEMDLPGSPHDGWIIGRKIVFFGRLLRFGGISKTWHCRLFRSGTGRCEDRLYDQHFVCQGSIGVIAGFMRDHQENSLSEWTARHNRWSDLEAAEVLSPSEYHSTNRVVPKINGNVIQRKRMAKSIYYNMPIFLRAFSYFFYRYFIRLGFLDGTEGLIFHVLQALWLRFLIDAKIYESTRTKKMIDLARAKP